MGGGRSGSSISQLELENRSAKQLEKKLAATYGPVFRLQLGGKLCVVVSYASAAREVLHDQDATFTNCDVLAAGGVITYGAYYIAWSHYGPVCQMLEKVCSRDLLLGATLDAFYGLRRQEVWAMVARVVERAREKQAVDVRKEAFLTVMIVLTGMLWGSGGGAGAEMIDGEFKALVGEIMMSMTPNLSDLFPLLRRFNLQLIEEIRPSSPTAPHPHQLSGVLLCLHSVHPNLHQSSAGTGASTVIEAER